MEAGLLSGDRMFPKRYGFASALSLVAEPSAPQSLGWRSASREGSTAQDLPPWPCLEQLLRSWLGFCVLILQWIWFLGFDSSWIIQKWRNNHSFQLGCCHCAISIGPGGEVFVQSNAVWAQSSRKHKQWQWHKLAVVANRHAVCLPCASLQWSLTHGRHSWLRLTMKTVLAEPEVHAHHVLHSGPKPGVASLHHCAVLVELQHSLDSRQYSIEGLPKLLTKLWYLRAFFWTEPNMFSTSCNFPSPKYHLPCRQM